MKMRRSLLTARDGHLGRFLSPSGSLRRRRRPSSFGPCLLTPDFTDYFEDIIARYEAENPGVKIDWKDIPDTTLREQFLAAAAAGDVPDVVNFPSVLDHHHGAARRAVQR